MLESFHHFVKLFYIVFRRSNLLQPLSEHIIQSLMSGTCRSASPLDQMFVIWTAANRISRSGVVIGPDQRITPLEALKAVTINAAYQYSEEKSKGSLETGKLADLVILDKNPLKVDPLTIKDIKVIETIKEGKTIYKAN